MSSEYTVTASVFSSWGGSGAVAAACIQAGASAAMVREARNGAKQTNSVAIQTNRGTRFSLTGCRSADGQKYDLLIILGPHYLIKTPQRRIGLFRRQQHVAANFTPDVNQAFLILHGKFVVRGSGVLVNRLGQRRGLPSKRQIDRDVVYLLEGKLKINRVYPVGVLKQMFLIRGKQAHRQQHLLPAEDANPGTFSVNSAVNAVSEFFRPVAW